MSNLLSPATGPVALPAKVAAPSVLAPGVPSLAAFLDLMIGKLAQPDALSPTDAGDRQNDAEAGKSLPDASRKPVVDPALAWLFGPVPLPTVTPQVQPIPIVPTAVVAPSPVQDAGATAIAPEMPVATATISETDTPSADTAAPTPNTFFVPQSKPANQPIVIGPIAPQPVAVDVTPLPIAVALPALFALATPSRDPREDNAASSSTPSIMQSALRADVVPVAPTGDIQRQTLDLGRQDWPQKMVDHIEALRDDANANDTSIRLKPEALGRIDVSLKSHADGAVSVRFVAEQPATRTLLIDATPQLTAAAEARGIRLSGTSVDLGQQGDQRPRPEIDRREPIINRVAPTGDEPEADAIGRIA